MIDSIIAFFQNGDDLARVIISILVLIAGSVLAKVVSSLIFRFRIKTLKEKTVRLDSVSKTVRDLIYIATIVIALLVLYNGSFILDIDRYINFIPILISFFLILLLAIVIANLIYVIIEKIASITGLRQYFIEYDVIGLYKVVMLTIRASLYILVFFVSINFALPNYPTFTAFINSMFFYLIIILFFALAYSSRRILQNLMSGFYLIISNEYRLGQELIYKGHRGHIIRIGYIKTNIETDKHYELVIPNSALISERFLKKSVSIELETLEKMKNQFIAQEPAHCGPASAEIILNIFGFNISQQKIGKMCNTRKGYGTHPKDLINAVQQLTNNKVKATWISADDITDLKTEVLQWLSDDALLIGDFDKKYLFANALAGHYVVIVAVEGEDLVILDPSSKRGGVYLVDADKMYAAMDTHSVVIEGKRGFIVIAPKGTTAYYRIEKGFIKPDSNIYQKMKKKFHKGLSSIRKQRSMAKIVPASILGFFEKYREKNTISRVWTPKERKKN